MNPGQQRFHDFLMGLVAPGNEAAAEAILATSFGQQDAGPLAPQAVEAAVAELTPLLKPEGVAELQWAAARMKEMAAHGPGDHEHGDRVPGEHHPGEHGHGGPGDQGPGGHRWREPPASGVPGEAAPTGGPTAIPE